MRITQRYQVRLSFLRCSCHELGSCCSEAPISAFHAQRPVEEKKDRSRQRVGSGVLPVGEGGRSIKRNPLNNAGRAGLTENSVTLSMPRGSKAVDNFMKEIRTRFQLPEVDSPWVCLDMTLQFDALTQRGCDPRFPDLDDGPNCRNKERAIFALSFILSNT